MDINNYQKSLNNNIWNFTDKSENNEELNSIFNSILRESLSENEAKFNTGDLLSIFIRKNRNKTNQILKEIANFFDTETINPELLMQCIDGIYNSLIDKNIIINFINLFLPLLVKSLYKINVNVQNISTINKMFLYIGKYLNKGGIYIRELVEKHIDILLEKFNKKETKGKTEKKDNFHLLSLKLLSQILKNSPMLAFNKIVGKNGSDRFLNVINCYKDPNRDIRVANGILIYHFLQMFKGRDEETKLFYLKLIYDKINREFTDKLKRDKDIPKDHLIFSGFLITIDNINLSEPVFFKGNSNFSDLIKDLFKCFDSKNNNVKVEFIKFIPKLYKLNKTEFRDSYENQFLGKINDLLNKETNTEIRNALFITIGKLSYFIDEESYKFFIDKFFILAKSLITDKKYIDDDLLKCLSDLMNNKKGIYITQIQSINVMKMMPKLFKTFFSLTKIDYLVSLMNFYEYNSVENMATTFISLNIISHIINGEFFNLEYFNRNTEIKKNFIGQGLNDILLEIRKDLFQSYKEDSYKKKTLSENFKLKINNPQIILNALTLFSLIPNQLFYKDMFIFFNDRLLPLLEFAPIKIYKKIIDLLPCSFIKIYQDDVNLSEYIFHNIIESIFTTSLNEQNKKIQIYSFKEITKQEKLMEFCFKKNNLDMLKIFGFYSSINEIMTQERIIKTVSEIALKDPDKNFYYIYVKKAIYSISFKFYYLDDLIQKENVSFTLYYITKYFVDLFYPSIPVLILDVTNYLILTSDLRSIMMINIFKTLIEIFKSDIIKEVNDNVIFKENCDLIFILLFDIMKMESINESQYDVLSELIYLIIKNQNIDIFNVRDIKKRVENSSFLTLKQTRSELKQIKNYFNDEKIISKLNFILDKINNKTIIEILYRNILNVENENCVLNTLKIFGLCGAIDPNKIENFFDGNNKIKYLLEIENNYRAIDEKAIQIITFNNNLNQYVEIDISSLSDPLDVKVVLLGLEILKMNKQQELSEKIILSLISLIKSIKSNDSIVVDIIIPTIIQIFPKFQIEQQKLLLECIRLILNKFEDKMKKYINDVIPFIINFMQKDYLEIIRNIISIFDEKYKKEFENYYSKIIQKYLIIINSDYENYFIYDNLFMLLIKNNEINSYLKILYEELKLKLFEQTNPIYINKLLNIIEQISKNKNCAILYSSIINNILYKLEMIFNQINCETEFKYDQKKILDYFLKTSSNSEKNILIIQNMLNIFKNISANSREHFISFLSVIYNHFDSYGLLTHPKFKKQFKSLIINKNDYTFMTTKELINQLFSSDNCKGNCIYGFHSSAGKIKKNDTLSKSFIKKESTKKEISINKEELIMKVLDNDYCNLEEDWNEWLKTCIKTVLEKSSSPYLSNFSFIADYYLSVASELSAQGFYSFYICSNEESKKKMENYLNIALKAPKATYNVILAILDLLENMDRRRANMSLNDFKHYGNICFKLRAYAKSLYYLEKSFLKEKDISVFEKLIHLYYRLGIPQWAYGLLKLVDRDDYKNIKNYEDKFIWYMNLGDYRKALEMIEEILLTEKNEERIYFLKKKKDFCKSELFDWEEIFSADKEENFDFSEINENYNMDKNEELKEIIEKELFTSIASYNLDKWEYLGTHIYKINKVIKEKFGEEEIGLFRDDLDVSDMYSGRISKEKNTSFNQNDRRYFSEYISYNELILKNINLLNKIDSSKIFDLNLVSALVNIMEGNFEVAKKYKDDAKELILFKLKPLLKESHIRGYALLINNQQISYLEDIIEYKEEHDGDLNYLKDMKQSWDKSFNQISFEPMFCRRLLFLYRFIFQKKDLFTTETFYGNILRKNGLFEQSKILFQNLKNNINEIIKEEKDEKNLLSLNEQKIKIELSYNKCLFKKGEINEAINQGKILVDLIENKKKSNIYQNINDKLKGKIYGNYALFIKKKLFLNNNYREQKEKQIKEQKFLIKKSNRYLSPKLVHRNIFLIGEDYFDRLKSKAIPKNSYDKEQQLLQSYAEKKIINQNKFNEYFSSIAFKNVTKRINRINEYLTLATKYYGKSHKYWHYFSNLNYEVYRYLHLKRIMAKDKGDNYNIGYSKNIEICKMHEISYANNVIKGVKKCLSLIGDNTKKGYQSCIKLIDIFFNLGGESDELLDSIYGIFNDLNSIIFILILPLLISRIGINNKKILDKLIQILVKLCLNFPTGSLISILIYKYSNSAKKKSIANKILELVEKENPKLKHIINNYEIFIRELNRCSSLIHEKWKKAIQDAANLLLKKDFNGLINELEPMHKLMKKDPGNLYGIHFNQCYYTSLKQAENYLKKYIKNSNKAYIKFAWEIYQVVYNDILERYKTMSTISLNYVSPLLSNIPENQIGLPGYYFLNILNKERKQLIIGKIKENNALENEEQLVYVKRIDKYLYVFNTKQKPRKISLIGTDDKEYKYLLKSNEDLRQDERIIQVFNFVNSMLSLDKEEISKKLLIPVYPVIPLSNITGLIGFLPNCETISNLIIEQRKENNIHPNLEMAHLTEIYPRYNSGSFISKVEAFIEVNTKTTKGYELSEVIWSKSLNCETWLTRRTNYAQSLAVMSVVGYILGLGDRHPNNLMMDRQNGKIIHIDYGDCFEIAKFRKRFPEKIPFRLTRMFVKALGVSEIEGAFRIISEKIMKLLRYNKDSLYTILNSLVYDPLVTFKFMLPFMNNNPKSEKDVIDMNNIKNSVNPELKAFMHSSSVIYKHSFDALAKLVAFSTEKDIKPDKQDKQDQYNLDNEKEEKMKMINEERKLLYYYEENDEIEEEDLNKAAQKVLNRIKEKLTGTDFNNKKPLDVPEQINRLINQAISDENLSQLYLGWSPFW